jgi:hypothetical protein
MNMIVSHVSPGSRMLCSFDHGALRASPYYDPALSICLTTDLPTYLDHHVSYHTNPCLCRVVGEMR